MAKVATSAPSGLAIARDTNKYTFSWKIPTSKFGAGQQCQYRLKTSDGWSKWTSLSVSATATKKTVTVSASSYFPTTKKKLSIISFRVRGQRTGDNYTWSAWTKKSFDVTVPSAPTVSQALSSSQTNVATYSWNAANDVKSTKLFANVLWESILVKNCTQTDGSKLTWKSSATGWQTGTGNASGSKTITEDTTLLASGSYTRWFRACSRGAQGASAWRYTKHVFATPYQVTVNASSAKNDGSGGMEASITWTAQTDAAHPIDSTIAQYVLETPAAGLACPSGASWQNANTTRDTTGKDAAKFTIDDTLDVDECLWLRVNTQHDSNVNYGAPALAKVGDLADPTGVSVSVNSSTHRATITATNASSVPDSFLAVLFRRSLAPNEDLVVGIIPHGSTSVTVQCPDWGSDPAVAFGVFAVVGSYSAKTRSDGADSYSVTALMRSANTIWDGGAVPVAPYEVTASKTAIEGTIRVTWNWSWSEADAAELSWADHEDAWESTAEPDTYEVSNLYASAWNISGLDAGKIWYIRVRLKSGETFGPYSDIIAMDLSAAPFKPVLTLSSPTTLLNNLFTAYWSYISADTTPQSFAEICIATISGGTITYGDVIARVETAQHVDIICPDDWTEGETYLLCLRVTSASGNKSEWSDPVAITVAEPLTATITETSLEEVTETVNPQSFSGDLITFETDTEEDVTNCVVEITAVQSGSGDPSPTNIRPISGWSEVNVNVNGNTTTVDLGQTVYGGSLNVTTGLLTITHDIVDLGTLDWSYDSSVFIASISGIKRGTYTDTNLVCAKYPITPLPYSAFTYGLRYNSSTSIGIKDSAYSDATTFKTAMSGVMLVYELATPQTVQLTPQQMATLAGENNVFANSGTISDFTIAEAVLQYTALTEMPLTVTVTGAGTGGVTTVIIERADDYHIERPDETERNGFEGETIIVYSQLGESQITIDTGELIGSFDDGGAYRLIATVQDGLGQSDSEVIEFEVHWATQALPPTATVVMDGTAAKITPTAPSGGSASDVCDIYRLSADRPVLIVESGTFGTTYVDPYPAIGGGHRIVTITEDGDYTTADGSFAWVDVDDGLSLDYSLIDFDGQQIALRYDLSLSNAWHKEFTETKYLGGSVTGDWAPAVDRTLSMSAASIVTFDGETIDLLRKLAVYPGICHVRTMDGSSFDADIQVTEARGYNTGSRKVKFDLSITRVDPEGLEGLPLTVWEEE